MKILYVTNRVDVGGIETNLVRLARELVGRGHTVIVASAPGTLVRDIEATGARHVELRVELGRPSADLQDISSLARTLCDERPDVVHVFSASAAVLIWLARRRLTVMTRCRWSGPVISTIMGIQTTADEARWRIYLRAFLTSLGATRLLVVSPAIDRLVRRLPVGSRRRCSLPVIGVEVPQVPATAIAQLRHELGLSPTDVVVSTIGRLSSSKRHDLFLQAAVTVKQAHPGASFLVVGEGPEKEKLLELAHELELGRVKLLGERRDVATILATTDVYVRPGVVEGFAGITVLEAQSLGVPVVAFETEDVKLAITHAVTGWLVPAGDTAALARAINLLIGDKDLAGRIGAAGKESVVSRFSVPAVVDGLEALYDQELTTVPASATTRAEDEH